VRAGITSLGVGQPEVTKHGDFQLEGSELKSFVDNAAALHAG